MPSQARPRRPAKTAPKRRVRYTVEWGRVLWFLVGANLALGLWFSPLTAPTVVRVTGAVPDDEPRLRQALQSVRGQPALAVDRLRLESLVLAGEDVRGATLTLNLFGRGRLAVETRRAVAAIAGRDGLYLSEDGAVYRSRAIHAGLPEVSPPEDALGASAALFAPWEPGRIARLCQLLTIHLPQRPWNVAMDRRGVISLRDGDSAVVVLGSTAKLEDKVSRLRELLATRPGLLEENREVNLTAPDRPVAVPKTP